MTGAVPSLNALFGPYTHIYWHRSKPATTTAVPFETTATRTRRLCHYRELSPESPTDTYRPGAETGGDGDIDMDQMDLEEEEEEEEDDSGSMDSDVPSASASALARPLNNPKSINYHHIAITTDII